MIALTTRWQYALTVIFIITLLSTSLLFASKRIAFSGQPLSQYNQVSCVMNSKGRDSFNILAPSHMLAKSLANQFCQLSELENTFSQITVSWLPRGTLEPAAILEQEYELMWGRKTHLAGLAPQYSDYYQSIKSLPSYDVFFLSHEPLAKLTRDTFISKRIGLLDDNYSQSGFQIPINTFRQLGLSIESLNIKHYQSRKALHHAFSQQEVDIITANSYSPKLYRYQAPYKLRIASNISSGAWFINKQLISPELKAIIRQYLDRPLPLSRITLNQ
ncbi:hypothetical protein L4D09_09245 [Photobacterium makurazakiensis]|uniref:hypothetical protein n=1 Tax=Photobacterium makurazakiensis TaxID=2910234 RepID=UPI003D0E6532